MKISISITRYSWPGGKEHLAQHLDRIASASDGAGVDTLWVADHLFQAEPGTEPTDPMLEAYTTLGYLAGRTNRVDLGTMVTWAGIRPAALLIKAVTTLDVLSGGRAWLGLGAGYRGDEAEMMGLPFPQTSTRFDILEDTLELARQMWAGDDTPFDGRQMQLQQPISHPVPLSRPGPKILIGGMGEKLTLPLVARHADACNLFDMPDGGETIRNKLSVLERACDVIGRDSSEIEKTVSARLEQGEDAASLIERCRSFADWGLDHVVLITNGAWETGQIETVGAALQSVAGLGVGSPSGST